MPDTTDIVEAIARAYEQAYGDPARALRECVLHAGTYAAQLEARIALMEPAMGWAFLRMGGKSKRPPKIPPPPPLDIDAHDTPR